MSEFVEYLREVFERLGPISARSMFGGYGVYLDGVMFALVADDTLYLKADEQTEHYFSTRNLPPFEYAKGGKRVTMSYFVAPSDVFDDPDEAALWARRSLDAALRNKQKHRGTLP